MELAPINVVLGLVVPVLLPAFLWLLWAFLTPRTPRLAGLLAGLAPAAAYAIAFWAVEPFPGKPTTFPLPDSVHYLFWSAALLLVFALVEALLRPHRYYAKALLWAPPILILLFTLTTAWRNFPGEAPDTLLRPPSTTIPIVLGLSAIVFLTRASAGKLACTAPTHALWVWGLASAFAGACIEMSGSHLVGTFRMLSLGLPLLPILLFWRKGGGGGELPAPTLTVITILYPSLLLAAVLYYALTPLNASLLAAAPLLPALLPGSLKGAKGLFARLSLALVPILTAAVLAFIPFYKGLQEMNGY